MKEYKFKINGNDYTVSIDKIEDGNAAVTVNGKGYEVELDEPVAAGREVTEPQAAARADVVSSPNANAGGNLQTINAPLPGVIIEICVKEGDKVSRGQKVAVLEAMKMENEIQSPADGIVKAVYVGKGASVLEGEKIAAIG